MKGIETRWLFQCPSYGAGGQFARSLRKNAEMYAGCMAGAIQKETSLSLIQENGFCNSDIQKEKSIVTPDDFLENYLTKEETTNFKIGSTGIFSITVYAKKPTQCGYANPCQTEMSNKK